MVKSAGRWLVLSLSLATVGAAAQTVTGSGTTNTVPVFTGSSAVGNSPISVSGSNVGIGTQTPLATLDVNGGIFVRGYATTSTAGSYQNQWTQLGQCQVTVQAFGCDALLQLIGGTSNGSGGGDVSASINWRVKQQAALGSAPLVEVDVGNITGSLIQPAQFAAVVTENDSTQTVVQLWAQVPYSYEVYNFTPTIVESSTNGVLGFSSLTGFSSSLPSGVGSAILGTSGNVEGTAAAPSFTFVGDNTTGIYQPSTGVIAFSTGGSEKMRIGSTGNVGIGTTTPQALLDVTDSSTSLAINANGTSSSTSSTGWAPQIQVINPSATANNWALVGFADAGGAGPTLSAKLGVQFTDRTNHYGDIAFITHGSNGFNERMRIMSTGNVGVGTAAPSALFAVGAGSTSPFQVNSAGVITTSGGLTVTSGGSVSLPSASIANSALQGSGSLTVTAGTGLSGGGSVPLGGAASLQLATAGTAGTYGSSTQIPVITTDAYGRVTGVTPTAIGGISTSWSALANPAANLALSTGPWTSTFTAGAYTGTNNLFTFSDTASNTGTGNLINISTAANSTLNPFAVYTAGGSSPSIQVAANGNVGIGTRSPGSTLEVNGSLKFTGQAGTQTMPWTGVLCGGDYAEAVDTTRGKETYEPGDVLVITEGEDADVKKSTEAYSTTVAGIFATKPGVIGRRQTLPKDGDEVPMAMIGIVPTKVTAENGPIRRGDLLVTSSRSGYAMKGTDRTRMLGAVIGKAMGSLDAGDGVIAVLVTLQ